VALTLTEQGEGSRESRERTEVPPEQAGREIGWFQSRNRRLQYLTAYSGAHQLIVVLNFTSS
jgi:hypothetical protein